MRATVKQQIYDLVYSMLARKIENYSPESEHKPFFTAIFSEDMVATHSVVHSFYTSFGMSVYEQLVELLATSAGFEVHRQYKLIGDIDMGTMNLINTLWEHDKEHGSYSKLDEIEQIRRSIYPSRDATVQPDSTVDVFVKRPDGEEFYIDIKTVKPNKTELEGFKRKLLLWVGFRLSTDRNAKVHTSIALPYNPYHPKPYLSNLRGNMGKVLDPNHDILVQEDFWNLVGGANDTYDELMGILANVGWNIRDRIDTMFR